MDSIPWRDEGALSPSTRLDSAKDAEGPYPSGDGVQDWKGQAQRPSPVSPPPRYRLESPKCRRRAKPHHPGKRRQGPPPGRRPRSATWVAVRVQKCENATPGRKARGRLGLLPYVSLKLFMGQFEQTPATTSRVTETYCRRSDYNIPGSKSRLHFMGRVLLGGQFPLVGAFERSPATEKRLSSSWDLRWKIQFRQEHPTSPDRQHPV